MRLFKCFLITIAFLFLAPSLAAATDDPLDDAIAADIGSGLGKMIADAINSAAEYQNQIADFNRDIAAARAEFWRQYPNGPHIRAATKRFSDLLLAKDIGLMNQTVSSGKLRWGLTSPAECDGLFKRQRRQDRRRYSTHGGEPIL